MEWYNIKGIILSIYYDLNNCTKDNWITAYTYIYKLFNKSFKTVIQNKNSNIVLDNFYNLMVELLNEIVNNSRIKLTKNLTIKKLNEEWDKIYLVSKIVNNIYDYFNKSYIRKLDSYNQDRYEYLDCFIIEWKKTIIDHFWNNILSEIYTKLNIHNNIFIDGISNIITQLNILDIHNTNIYEIYFENKILDNLVLKFNKQANEFRSYSIIEYLSKSFNVIDYEIKISNNNYSKSTDKIITLLDNQFLVNNLDFIIDDISIILSDNNFLRKFYNRIKKYSIVEKLKDKFLEYSVKSLSTTINNIDNESLIDLFIQVEKRFSDYYRIFDNITFDFKKKFKTIINTKDICNLLVTYIHLKIKDTSNEEFLDNLYILDYIDNKELFVKLYQKFLAKRLLKNGVGNESKIVPIFSLYLGYETSNIISKMIKDIQTSEDLNKLVEYKNIKFSTSILSCNVWPLKPSNNNIFINEDISKNIKIYEKLYNSKFSGRKLSWCYNLFNGIIETNIFERKYYINLNLYQADLLLLFNNTDEISKEEIKTKLLIDDILLDETLQNFIKSQMLKIEGQSVILNKKFKSKKNKINFNTKSKKENKDEIKKIEDKVDLDCRLIIESSIVRIIKSRKTLEHSQLISECIKNISHRFTPKISSIKKSISKLIDQGYLERSKENSSIYLYLP